MMDYPRSDLTKRLVRDGMRGNGVGAPKLHGMKERGAASDGAHSQVTDCPEGGLNNPNGRSGGDKRPIRLAWVNPTATRKGASGAAPLLVIVK